MHRLLQRQIKKILGNDYLEDKKLEPFFNLVSDYYIEKDKERNLLENALEVNSLELTDSNVLLQKMAFHDNLTGLSNRKLFEKELELTLKSMRRHQRNIALLFFDLDDFKAINDSYGHTVGDATLVEASTTISGCIRECDILARWGGDEFVLLLDELTNVDDCLIIIQNIQKAFKKPLTILNHEISLSFSIGVNIYESGQKMLDMIKNADMAMYKAKESGKNAYAFYTSEIGEKVISDIKLNTELLSAIENNEFKVLYQPQIDILSGDIIGAEALVRWIHPTKGTISPYKFIPLAEEKGYILEIGQIVLEQSCKDMKRWIDKRYGIKSIAVNLSVKQIRDKNFITSVKSVLNQTGLNAKYLEFEVTETMIMKEYEHAFDILETLRNLGITLSIDDFGTGYSSLAYLKRLPIDKIKIDKSFIDEISDNENDIEIIKAIIAMSHSLGLKVLAEGVESKLQLEKLKKLNCEDYQGYYFSKPIAVEEFEKMLHEQSVKEIQSLFNFTFEI